MPGASPVHSGSFRAGPKVREFQQLEIARIMEQKITKWTTTKRAAAIVFLPRKASDLRFCVSYKRLNALTHGESYPILRMDDFIDSLGKSTVIFTTDHNRGFEEVEINEKDKDKILFTFHPGLYWFTQKPFGFKSAPGSFQRNKDVILESVIRKTTLVHLDNTVILFKKPEKHITHVKQVSTLLHKPGVTLTLKKCRFYTNTMDYLKHVIWSRSPKIAQPTTDGIMQLKEPCNVTQLR